MAKIIKAKVYYTKDASGTHYSGGYPKNWQANKIAVMGYGDAGEDERGTYDIVMGLIREDDYATQLISDNPGVVWEIQKDEANEFGDKYWRPQTVKILDQRKVIEILAKAVRGEKLTQKERDAIDPEKPERGLNKTKKFNIDDEIAGK